SVILHNNSSDPVELTLSSNAYQYEGPWSFRIASGRRKKKSWVLKSSGNWYDFSVTSADGYLRRFAGRLETGKHSVSDPAMAAHI
ncbi:MAG: DUF756 domain-containing protein, partial [Chitinophagaceae bacterium]|nr:DUF756 domain-containing protein [Chitinophagaceae bacterium]